MKKCLCLLLFVPVAALSQPAASAPPTAALPVRALNGVEPSASGVEAPKLTKFNLDFPGGTPEQLVAAIEKATGRPLNVVIPDEYANESISALRMTQVTVPDLFGAMGQASIKTERYPTGVYSGGSTASYSYQQMKTSISFQTSGLVSDNSIWYFRGREKVPDFAASDLKPTSQKICRFYALTPYLEQGLKVEDITTAIQTGWKMLESGKAFGQMFGQKKEEAPNLSFHKETKLLIAVGEPGQLETIDAVLKALSQNPATDPATGLPVDPYARMTEIERRAAAAAAKSPVSPKPAPTSVSEP